MSKKSKSESKAKRASNKRATKAANKARWESFIGRESNRKKRSSSTKKRLGLSPKHQHPNGPCGNLGCLKCSDIGKASYVRQRFLVSGPVVAMRTAHRLGVLVEMSI